MVKDLDFDVVELGESCPGSLDVFRKGVVHNILGTLAIVNEEGEVR